MLGRIRYGSREGSVEGGVESSTEWPGKVSESHLRSEVSEDPERGEGVSLSMSAEELSRQEATARAEDSKGLGRWLLEEAGEKKEV